MEEGIQRKPYKVSGAFKESRKHIYDYTCETFGEVQAMANAPKLLILNSQCVLLFTAKSAQRAQAYVSLRPLRKFFAPFAVNLTTSDTKGVTKGTNGKKIGLHV